MNSIDLPLEKETELYKCNVNHMLPKEFNWHADAGATMSDVIKYVTITKLTHFAPGTRANICSD